MVWVKQLELWKFEYVSFQFRRCGRSHHLVLTSTGFEKLYCWQTPSTHPNSALEDLDSLLIRASRSESSASVDTMKDRVSAAVTALDRWGFHQCLTKMSSWISCKLWHDASSSLTSSVHKVVAFVPKHSCVEHLYYCKKLDSNAKVNVQCVQLQTLFSFCLTVWLQSFVDAGF
jgi:hypothetical protein